MKDILVIGSSNIDLIMKMDHLPEKGQTVTDAEFLQTFGGKGGNQAVAAARAGGRVTFVTCVGDDSFGHAVIANYQNDHINTDYAIMEKGIATGSALIMIGSDGDNYISVAPGANYRLKKENIDGLRSVMQNSGMILLQYEILPETLEYILKVAAEMKVPAMLNFAPARSFNVAGLTNVSILVVNETEAQFLTRIPDVNRKSAPEACRILHSIGVKSVIVTMGVQGSYVSCENFRGAVPAFSVKAVDATAAGDVYCGTLAVSLMEGKTFEESVRFSSAAAAISVTRLGAQPSAPFRSEIDEFLNSHK